MGNVFSSCSDYIDSEIFQPPDNSHLYKIINFSQIDYENIKIPYVVLEPNRKTNDNIIIFSHGNATDIFSMFSYFKILSNMSGSVVLGYDYPGYSVSSHIKPSEENCYKAIQGIVDFAINSLGFSKKNIFLIGQSLGTGVVANYAAENNWENPIMLISPYKTICKVVLDSSLTSFIDKFETINKTDDIICPVKIIHGLDDQVINYKHSEELYSKLSNKSLCPKFIKGVGHNDILETISQNDIRELFSCKSNGN